MNTRLMELARELRVQLDEWRLWHDDPTAAFEQLADEFYHVTGWMAPGKSVPPAMGPHDDARRRTEWETWQNARREKRQAMLEQVYEALVSSNWRDLSTAPKEDGELVLLFPSRCWCEESDRGEVGYWDEFAQKWFSYGPTADDWTGYTHWMPLPAPPKETR